ncbi:MAG: right-handed parallel beta-helix repeat-containing protein [Limisphaera sp.]|nr:right-handed parallel beta-helix repeat-containing protein [Limisphaera sp.]
MKTKVWRRSHFVGSTWWSVGWMLAHLSALEGAELHVGPGHAWADPAAALAEARAGDVIVVHPQPGNAPYPRVALRVRQPDIVLRAASQAAGPIPLSGEGADLSGRGVHPRAIVQFDPDADGARLEGFELYGATNETGNAAGVRITGARNVVVRNCVIRDNDMGVMSDGAGRSGGAGGLVLEGCRVYRNGSPAHGGYSHNLYLGGESVTLQGCVIHSSRVGHNLKSRAHQTRVLGCYLYGAAERELDLVDAAGWTTRPGSHAWVVGCVIVKADPTRGNRAVVHFGQDGRHDHTGTLWLVHNTIVTPHVAPVVELSAPGTSAWLEGNVVWDGGRRRPGQRLVEVRSGAEAERVRGRCNWLAAGYRGDPPPRLEQTQWGAPNQELPWTDPARGDYHLQVPVTGITDGGAEPAALRQRVPGLVLYEFTPPAGWRIRPELGPLDLGAFEGPSARSTNPVSQQ